MKTLATAALALSAVITLGSCNNASKNSVNNADSANSAKMDSGQIGLSSDEAQFMVKAANGGMTEIQLSQHAQKNSDNPRIKSFAAMIIEDHTSANEQLAVLAQSQNVTLPDSLSSESTTTVKRLSIKAGKSFDKEYMKTMVKDHQSTVDDFKNELNQAKNAQLQAWISNTLPTLEKHLDSARILDSLVNK